MRYLRCYHGSVEPIPYITAWNPVKTLGDAACSYSIYNPLIFFRFDGAGGIDEEASRLEDGEGVFENQALAVGEVSKISRSEAPLDFRIAAERSGARAGRVNQNAVELSVKWEHMCCVQHHTGAAGELAQAVEVEVAGDGLGTGLDGLEGFVAGGGAEVEEFEAGMEVEQGDDRLGAGVHLAVVQKVGFGRKQERFGGGDGGGGAVMGSPGGEEPGGGGEFGGLVRESYWVARHFAQHGVDEAGGGAFAGAFDEFDGGGDGGVGGDAVEVTELEDAEAKGDADFRIELDGATGEVVDEEVELELVAEAAED